MGLNFFASNSSYDDKNNSIKLPTPDPKNYKIISQQIVNGYLILYINYPDCTNYEGYKILLYKKGITLKDIKNNQDSIDPHFSNNKKFISPIARFEPTTKGLEMAFLIANKMK